MLAGTFSAVALEVNGSLHMRPHFHFEGTLQVMYFVLEPSVLGMYVMGKALGPGVVSAHMAAEHAQLESISRVHSALNLQVLRRLVTQPGDVAARGGGSRLAGVAVLERPVGPVREPREVLGGAVVHFI
jgi:hypothetical protein